MVSNYRPVLVWCVFSKTFEHVLYKFTYILDDTFVRDVSQLDAIYSHKITTFNVVDQYLLLLGALIFVCVYMAGLRHICEIRSGSSVHMMLIQHPTKIYLWSPGLLTWALLEFYLTNNIRKDVMYKKIPPGDRFT